MKIAFFLGTLKKEDGVGRVVEALNAAAQKNDHECLIVTGWAEYRHAGLNILEIPSMVFPLYKDYKMPWPGQRGFKKQLDEWQPDIIHAHSPDPSAFAALKYARARNIPFVATHHSDFSKYLSYYHLQSLDFVVWRLLRKLYNPADLITAPSQDTATDLQNHDVKEVTVLPWGVDTEKFNPRFRSLEFRQKYLGEEKKYLLLHVSRLTWEKDLRTLAKIYDLLKQKRNDFVLLLAGDGPARADLEKLMPGAIFLGHIDGEELSRVYASADMLLFPSSTETFGNVIVEALASGVVPVVAHAGGSKQVVNEKVGIFAEPKNAADFAHKINALLDAPEKLHAMHLAAQNYAQNFTWSKVWLTLEKYYQQLLTANK